MMLTTLHVTLTLAGPILSHSSSPGEAHVDAPMARTRHRPPHTYAQETSGIPDEEESYFLPFSLVRGRLRQSLEELQDELGLTGGLELKSLLGRPTEDGDYDPWRGRLGFSDFVYVKSASDDLAGATPIIVNIAIDPKRKAGKEGAVNMIERPFQVAAGVDFSGDIYFLANDTSEADRIQAIIEKGLRWTVNFGSLRTVSFGQVKKVSLQREDRPVPQPTQPTKPVEFVNLELTFLDPFCITKRRISDNLFESSDTIPGGAIKGALASMLQQMFGLPSNTSIDGTVLPDPWKTLGRNFAALRFTHAFPYLEGARRQVLPLSLVISRGMQVRDVAAFDRCQHRDKSEPSSSN